ncbi:MAG: YceI family protein [Dinoroseobacter sp.]|nr:YceI family protein [Dinoroseobacter sp.]
MKNTLWATVAVLGLAGAASAEGWTLDGNASHIAFGSVKSHIIGEVHTFSGLSGAVSEDGKTSIEIELSSLETQIDIRNERMAEHVFKLLPSAQLTAQLEMDEFGQLDVGSSKVMEIDFDLALVGNDVPLYGEIFVMRVGEDKVLVTTNSMVFIDTEELGIDAGVDKLQELASLEDITRAVPVTMRFMFNRDGASES